MNPSQKETNYNDKTLLLTALVLERLAKIQVSHMTGNVKCSELHINIKKIKKSKMRQIRVNKNKR